MFCGLAILTVVTEVGRRCFPGQDAAIQAEISLGLAKVERFVLTNGQLAAKELDAFKRDQGQVGAPKASLCRGGGVELYESMKSATPEELRAGIDKSVSRPGKPTWGSCL